MALGAVFAAIVQPPSRGKLLTIAGVDVTKEPGTLGLGSDPTDVEVTHAGPSAVSSMTFNVDDPKATLAIFEGDPITFVNLVTGTIIFQGWVQTVSSSVAFGDQGRVWEITAVGPEIILDWAVVPTLTIPVGTGIQDAVQAAVAAATWTGPLRAFASPNGSLVRSTQLKPIEGSLDVLTAAVTVSNTTLRETIRQVIAACATGSTALCTVDMTFGLRLFIHGFPVDFTVLAVADTADPRPANLVNLTDYGPRIRAVSVIGGNAAGTGIVTDGTGLPGATGTLTDATILTAAALAAAGADFLARYQVAGRGSFDLEDWAADDTVKPGGNVTVASAALGLTAGAFAGVRIGSIVKRYNAAGRETWHVTYGGNPPSAVRTLRRLTRNQLS